MSIIAIEVSYRSVERESTVIISSIMYMRSPLELSPQIVFSRIDLALANASGMGGPGCNVVGSGGAD